MKKHIIIIFIALCLIVLGFICNFLNYKDNNSGSNIHKNDKDNAGELIILVDESYSCLMPDTCTNPNPNLDYKIETYYHFSVISKGVENGQLEKKYIFDNVDSYNEFKYNPNSINIESHENKFDDDKLIKSYFYFMQFNGTTSDVSKYLEELKEKDFICQKVS